MSLSFDTTELAGCLQMSSYDCHRSVPAPFLTKTYYLVDDPATDDIVSWGEDNTTFVVWRPPEFARDLLPNYFKHNNFSSFVRQLNTYGFRKIVPDRWEFANEFFRRGEKQLLCEIHRRKNLQNGSGSNASGQPQQSRSHSPSVSNEDQTWSPLSSPLSSPRPALLHPPPPPTSATVFMCDENERLRKDNSLLLSEVSRLRRLYDETMVVLHQQSKSSLKDLTWLRRVRGAAAGGVLSVVSSEGFGTKLRDPFIAEQLDTAARKEQIRELSLQVMGRNVDPASSGLTLPAPALSPCVDSTTRGLLVMRQSPCLAVQSWDSATPKASTLSFLDGKLREIASSCTVMTANAGNKPQVNTGAEQESAVPGKNTPKLFGVPLRTTEVTSNCPDNVDDRDRKRPRSSNSRGTDVEPPAESKDTVAKLPRPPPPPPSASCVKSELGNLETRPMSSVEAPWLQICAARNERVYI